MKLQCGLDRIKTVSRQKELIISSKAQILRVFKISALDLFAL